METEGFDNGLNSKWISYINATDLPEKVKGSLRSIANINLDNDTDDDLKNGISILIATTTNINKRGCLGFVLKVKKYREAQFAYCSTVLQVIKDKYPKKVEDSEIISAYLFNQL